MARDIAGNSGGKSGQKAESGIAIAVRVHAAILRQLGRAHKLIAAAVLATICLTTTTAASAQSTFTFQSRTDNYTAVLGDGTGRTITVSGQPRNGSCVFVSTTGYTGHYARTSVAACDRTIVWTITTSGFLIDAITFPDMDDFDGTGPRDLLAANVPGVWTSPTIEVHSFASPPAFANQASRLQTAGGVGTFLANTAGENPTNETATFNLTTPARTFNLLFDDAQDGRDAVSYINFAVITVANAQGTIVATNDSVTGVSSSAGGTAVVNAFTGDTLNGTAAGPANTVLSVAPGSAVPAGLTFNTATGAVNVAAGTPIGTYSFNYQICEIGFPANCRTATILVGVTGSVDLAITKTNGTTEVTSGSTTTYTTTVTHNSGDPVTGAVVTDTPGAGITCGAANPVTITGDGVPAGSFTFADLTGAGIALGTLSSGQSTTLTYSCQVN